MPSSSCCVTRSRCCGGRRPGHELTGPTGRCWKACTAAAPPGLAGLVRAAGDAAALASGTWSGAAGPIRTGVAVRPWRPDSASWCCGWLGRTRLGLSADPWRAVPSGVQGQGRGEHRVDHPAARWRRSGAQAVGRLLAAVPAGSGPWCAGGGLLHGGHGVPAAAVCAVCDRDRDPSGPCARCDAASGWGVGGPAGPQPGDEPRGGHRSVPVCAPRPGHQVHRRVRRGLCCRGDQGAHHAGAGAARECLRRAVGRHRSA
jgi:hypothetical protein